MNISQQVKEDQTATVTIDVAPIDYLDVVDKEIKKVGKNAQIKGFRAGAVPKSVVQKMYGKSILFGKKVNAFTDAEETAAGLMHVVPFTLESRIRELGGLFESVANWQPHAVRDGNLITGQNPASSAKVAALVLDALRESARLAA